MGKHIQCCISNLSMFQYGETLQQFVEEGHHVQLERCLNFCVGCRNEPALMVNGKWASVPHISCLRTLVDY